jgi:hypothetical protein
MAHSPRHPHGGRRKKHPHIFTEAAVDGVSAVIAGDGRVTVFAPAAARTVSVTPQRVTVRAKIAASANRTELAAVSAVSCVRLRRNALAAVHAVIAVDTPALSQQIKAVLARFAGLALINAVL